MAIVNSRAAIEPKTGKAAIFVNETIHSLIRKLFANNEQGFAYDPNDLTTMFQDAAGTVPVTAAGQPVGLMLDKSKGLELGTELIKNGAFESLDFWTANNTGIIELVSNKLRFTRFSISDSASQSFQTTVNKFYKVKVNASLVNGAGAARIACGSVNSIASSQNTMISSFSGSLSFVFQAKSTTSYVLLGATSDGAVIDFDDVSIVEIAGNHAYQTTSASRPILRQNAITGAYYLEFDGSDDFLVTNSIDFTSTDKVSLFAGVRKLRDVVTGIVCELSVSVSNVGTFNLKAPHGADTNFGSESGGSIPYSALCVASGYASPIAKVVTATNNISGKRSILFVNSIQAASSTANQGVGNYGNYPLYIGRRAGTYLPFNGHIYGLIGIGKLTSDSETTAIEKELAKRTGVTLNV